MNEDDIKKHNVESAKLRTGGILCEECKYYDASSNCSGQCRRHTPVYHYDENEEKHTCRWPTVDVYDWCGEFELDADE